MSTEAALKGSFRKFVWRVWKHLLLPDPTVVQYDMARYLETGPRRRFLQAFRGVGKTWVTAAYVVWRLWRDPQIKVMIVSANEKKATEIATFIRRLIEELPELEHLRPGEGQRDSVLAFDVGPARAAVAPSVRADGIFGQLTGGRADILLSDDVEVPKNSETEPMRDKLRARTKEYAAIIKPDVGEIIYLGTPQTEQSIYADLPDRGYDVRIWPARYPCPPDQAKPDDVLHYERALRSLAPLLRDALAAKPSLGTPSGTTCGGAPTDPERFHDMDLMEREAEYGRSGFMLQFMLSTRLSDAERYPLKLRDLVVMDVDLARAPLTLAWGSSKELAINDLPNVGFDGDRYHRPFNVSPDWANYTGKVLFIDPAGRGKDETGYAVVKHLNGLLYLRKAGGLRGGYTPENLAFLATLAKTEGCTLVLIESNFGDGMYSELFKPVLTSVQYPCAVEEVHSTGQKERRVLDVLEPVVQQHRLVVDRSLVETDFRETDEGHYRLFYQLTHMTRARASLRHDDRLEAVAGAVAYFVQSMAQNSKVQADKARDKAQDQQLKDFIKLCKGPNAPRARSITMKRRW